MYRVQVLGKNELAMHWQRHKVGAAHWRAMAERGETMPVAIALGGDPASVYAASAPLPPTIDEYLFAGFCAVAGAPRQGRHVGPRGPAEAEIVIEGYVDRARSWCSRAVRRSHRFYSLADYYPKVHVTAVHAAQRSHLAAHDRGPAADGRLLPRPRDRADLHAVTQTHHSGNRRSPHAGRGDLSQSRVREHRQQYPGQAYKGDERLWGQGLMSLAKVNRRPGQGRNVRDPRRRGGWR